MKPKLYIMLTAKTTTGSADDIVLVTAGPALELPLNITEKDRQSLHAFLDYTLSEIERSAAKSLPSLPESVSEQPAHLARARQWFNLVESGQKKARCMAWEADGKRHILITTEDV